MTRREIAAADRRGGQVSRGGPIGRLAILLGAVRLSWRAGRTALRARVLRRVAKVPRPPHLGFQPIRLVPPPVRLAGGDPVDPHRAPDEDPVAPVPDVLPRVGVVHLAVVPRYRELFRLVEHVLPPRDPVLVAPGEHLLHKPVQLVGLTGVLRRRGAAEADRHCAQEAEADGPVPRVPHRSPSVPFDMLPPQARRSSRFTACGIPCRRDRYLDYARLAAPITLRPTAEAVSGGGIATGDDPDCLDTPQEATTCTLYDGWSPRAGAPPAWPSWSSARASDRSSLLLAPSASVSVLVRLSRPPPRSLSAGPRRWPVASRPSRPSRTSG